MNLSAENIGAIRELVRSGYPLKARDAKDLLGHNDHLVELLEARGRLMLGVEIERDRLKTENDALRAKRLERAARTKKLVDIASSHRRDAVALRKELESHKRMLLAAACDLGAIGEALGAEMDDDGSELEGIATQLRKDAERLQSATAFVQKLCGSAGKQPSVATGYLHDILSALGKGEKS